MNPTSLSSYFRGVAAKRLSAVEADVLRSNQRELNGVNRLKELLGEASDGRIFHAGFLYLSDTSEDHPLSADGQATWYDARNRHPTRSEYRLYFQPNSVMEAAREGDLLVIGLRPDGRLLMVVAAEGSVISSQIEWLFGLPPTSGKGFALRPNFSTGDAVASYARRAILSVLGIEPEIRADEYLPEMLRLFAGQFPGTREFSNYARRTMTDTDARESPDEAILRWMDREEALFRTLERHAIRARLAEGFRDDVDGFIRYSLSVQNRRKARAGFALENHVQAALDAAQLRFEYCAKTENRSRPDFLFPGSAEYRDPRFPFESLLMLGVKSSCKDRWRQVLTEADRIPRKHLFTLETGISGSQISEMHSRALQLVVPLGLHAAFAPERRASLMSLRAFIDLVRQSQRL
jgi:hypothetical protein